MVWKEKIETADCAGKCGKKVPIVIQERDNGSRMLDLASTQAKGTMSVQRGDCGGVGGHDHYCRECFLVSVLDLFKGMMADDKEG